MIAFSTAQFFIPPIQQFFSQIYTSFKHGAISG